MKTNKKIYLVSEFCEEENAVDDNGELSIVGFFYTEEEARNFVEYFGDTFTYQEIRMLNSYSRNEIGCESMPSDYES